MVRCVSAQPNSDSNFGLVLGAGGYGAACYVENGVPETGMVTPCLLGIVGPNNSLLFDGMVTFCAVTGFKEDQPVWSCASSYEEVRDQVIGI